MKHTGMINDVANFRVWKCLVHVANLTVITKIQHALDDVASVFFWIYRFRVNVPKERAAEFHALILAYLYCNFLQAWNLRNWMQFEARKQNGASRTKL